MINITLDAPFVACDVEQNKIDAREHQEALVFDFELPMFACSMAEERIDTDIAGVGILSGSVAWGGIVGTLSDQADLQSALTAKASSADLADEEEAREDADEILQEEIDGKQDTISDLATIRSNATAGKSASDTIATYGDIVTHNASEFLTEHQSLANYYTKTEIDNMFGDYISAMEDLR